MMETLRQGPKPEGNSGVLTMLRSIRSEGMNDPWLKDRVNRESTRTSACDFTYLLNTMEDESTALRNGDRCAVYAYDQVDRQEVCLFDTQVEEAVWFTSTWACTTRTGLFKTGRFLRIPRGWLPGLTLVPASRVFDLDVHIMDTLRSGTAKIP